MSAGGCLRERLHGVVSVDLPAKEAFFMFTPCGERAWAHGWNPSFPSADEESTEPGTVFLTSHSGRETIWVITNCETGRSISYAVATPGERSGLVGVACAPSRNGTSATVTYDLTALDAESNESLRHFAANFTSFLAHWELSIAEAIGKGPHKPAFRTPSSSNERWPYP